MSNEKVIYYLNQQLNTVLPNSPQMVALYEAIDIVKEKEKEKEKEKVHREERKTGHWEGSYDECIVICSECGSEHNFSKEFSNYCPRCGAKMRFDSGDDKE